MRQSAGKILPAGAFALFLISGTFAFAQGALQPIRIDASAATRERDMQLEVFLNGEATGLILAFKFSPKTNILTARRGELEKAGIKVPGSGSPDTIVRIDTLGLPFNFDDSLQKISFTARTDQRLARR